MMEGKSRSGHLGVVLSFEESQAARASIGPLVAATAERMERVNRLIVDRTRSDVTLIPEVARYLMDSGGKRLRPMVTIASAQACGYRGDGDVKLAASVEFMHTATLFHDDVVDQSDTRRGKRTARLVWGNQESVLVGDFLLGQAFKMMVEVGSLDALEVLSAAAATIAEGEVMQLTTAKNTETTEDEYLAVIRAKTAVLFSAAAENSAAVLARITSRYSSSVVSVFLAVVSCITSPSAIVAAAAESTSSASSEPASTIILKAWPSRKSPTSTLS